MQNNYADIVARFSKSTVFFVVIVLMLTMVSCHKEPIMFDSMSTINIKLQKKYVATGIADKSAVAEFEAIVFAAYEDDTVAYKCSFVAAGNIPDLYIYDYAKSDVVYVVLGKPLCLLVEARIGETTFHGESEVFILDDEPVPVTIELISSRGYIDLGLPSGRLWSNCNLGADSPEEFGTYYAWGEVAGKKTYTWDTYSYYSDSSITKYSDSDGLSSLEPSDDAATAELGTHWRIPTKTEFEELLDNCITTLSSSNGVRGYLFTGPNGNSIFLPMAGGYDKDGLLSSGESGFYWLSTLNSNDFNFAWGFLLDADSLYTTCYYRMYGQTIRPVYVEQ